jgi:phosphatidate cytidylyltransferase
MLRQRLVVASILIPLLVAVIALGGPAYLLTLVLAFGLSAWEYARLFRGGGSHRPATPLIVAGVLLLVISGWFPQLNPGGLLFAVSVGAALIWHLFDFEAGAGASGTDFGITVAGIFYLGWLGSYFASLRLLPQGQWWLLLAMAAVMITDGGAYAFGRLWGRHKLAPRLSPNKTWEGYGGGVLTSVLFAAFVGLLFDLGGVVGPASHLTWQAGALVGLAIGALSPLGDLGVSMFKRQFGAKDTGTLLPGHGGMFDRIDSWLVAIPLAYFLTRIIQR